jgi:hypothetical protein
MAVSTKSAPRIKSGLTPSRKAHRRPIVPLLRNLQGYTDPGDGPDGMVGDESEPRSDIAVTGVMDGDTIRGIDGLGDFGHLVTGIGEGDKRPVDLGRLIGRWCQFTADRTDGLHMDDCTVFGVFLQYGGAASSHR